MFVLIDIFKLVASKVSLLLRKLNYKTFDNFVDSFVELIKQESPSRHALCDYLQFIN